MGIRQLFPTGRYILTISRSFLLVALLSPSVSFGATYYVRQSGGSYGLEDGTSYANAFDGFGDISGPTSGDRVYICGEIDEQLTISSGLSGVEFSWDCPEEAGVIDRDSANATRGVSIAGTDVTLTNPVIREVDDYAIIADTGSSSSYLGLTINGGDIHTCTDTVQTCIRYVGTHVTINGVTIHNCYTDCIWGKGSAARITSNTFYDVAMSGQNAGDAIQVTEVVTGTIIRGNVINHDDYDSKYCIIATGVGLTRIEHNECTRASGLTTGAGIYTETSAWILGNIVDGGVYNIQCAQQGDEADGDCLVAGNYGKNATTYAVSIGSNAVLAKVFNNTFLTKQININNTGAVQLKNNILYGQSVGIQAPASSALVENYNLFDGVATPVTVNNVSQSIGADSINGDSGLASPASGPELNSDSQAIAAGVYVYQCYAIGGKCSGAINMGAWAGDAIPYGYALKPKRRR